jgi:hypothetical protein
MFALLLLAVIIECSLPKLLEHLVINVVVLHLEKCNALPSTTVLREYVIATINRAVLLVLLALTLLLIVLLVRFLDDVVVWRRDHHRSLDLEGFHADW